MHFVIHVFSNHFEVLHDVTPIDLLDQSAFLFSTTPVPFINIRRRGGL